MMHGKNLIDGEWSAEGKTAFKTFNPASNDANEWIFYEAHSSEVELAVSAACRDFKAYSSLSGKRKGAFLRNIAGELELLRKQIVHAYCLETGLPDGRANGELGRTINQLLMFAGLAEEGSWVEASIDTAIPDRAPIPKPDIRKMLFPLGPIAVFGASNFPLAFSTAGGDTASALAAGCPVIVKSHPLHAGTGELVATAIHKAMVRENIPSGVFANLNSKDHHIGEILVQHPGIKAVGFTGSFGGGTALQRLAREREEPIPVFAEMGSVNPVVILPSAIREKSEYWATQLASSMNLGAGQFCTNPGILIAVEGDDLDHFLSDLEKAVNTQPSQCMLHPEIHKKFTQGFRRLLSKPSVSKVAEGQTDDGANTALPTLAMVNAQTLLKDTDLMEEVFGPFSILVKCRDEQERLDIINALKGQLTMSILGSEADLGQHEDLLHAAQARTGRLIINGVPTGVEVCPSMQHGGPYPATTDSRFTSVGTGAIKRWVRPIAFQDLPETLLPDALKSENPLAIYRMINGAYTKNTAGS